MTTSKNPSTNSITTGNSNRQSTNFSVSRHRLCLTSNFHLGWHNIRYPPYVAAPTLSNPRTHLVWLKTDSERVEQVYVIITDGNLNILNDLYLDMREKNNQYSLLVAFLQKNILVNRSSPVCGRRVHADRARIERVVPEFLACCHYRSIDVDVLDVLCQRWARQVYDTRP